MDIVHDTCIIGKKFRILSILDEFTRNCFALDASTGVNLLTVRGVLRRLFTTRAVPRFLRRDIGGEFIAISTAMVLQVV